jgi:RNA polymerase sigma factor (sigma-70 family)
MNREAPLASVEALLTEARWLRRLARSLVDDGAAEDVVQETYVAAMAAPPEADRPLRPWLATVLRNFARIGYRGAGRRLRNEQRAFAEPAPPLPTPEELLVQRQRQRLVAETIEALEEPYRSTLLFCYAEGLTPSEIARRQQVPPATVRARLRRGLALARARLDQQHGGDRRRWSVALTALAGRRVPARPPTSPLVPRNPSHAEVLPMKLVQKVIVIAVGGGLVGAAVLGLQRGQVPVVLARTQAGREPARVTPASEGSLGHEGRARKMAPFVGAGLPALVTAAHGGEAPLREELIGECVARRQKLAVCKEALADARATAEGGTPEEQERRRRELTRRYQEAAAGSPEELRGICAAALDAAPQAGRPLPTRAQLVEVRPCWDEEDCVKAIACAQAAYAGVTPPSAPDPAGENAEHRSGGDAPR